MIIPGPPAHVQLARLAHTLEGVLLALRAGDYDRATEGTEAATRVVEQLQRSVK